jgi:hypothetical protein
MVKEFSFVNSKVLLSFYIAILASIYIILSYLNEVEYAVETLILITLFWAIFSLAVFQFPLKDTIEIIFGAYKRKLAITILGVYLVIHYFVYSIALEALLLFLFPGNIKVSDFRISFALNPIINSDFFGALITLTYNPVIAIITPPYFGIILSFYSIVLGLIVAFLVSSNIIRALELFSLGKSFKYIALLPLFGVISGSTCCLSIPYLITIFLPSIALGILLTPVGYWTLFSLYIILPSVTAIALKLNLRQLNRIQCSNIYIQSTRL